MPYLKLNLSYLKYFPVLGAEGDWFWLRSKESVGDYVWLEERGPDYNTANNCLTLDFAVGFKGVDKEYVIIFTCLRESLNP